MVQQLSIYPFPLLRKYWRLNYWVNMKTVHKSFHLRLFAIFSSIEIKQLLPVVRGGLLSVFTWRHSSDIGVPKQWNGDHVVSQTSPVGVELFSDANVSFFPINLHRCWPREWQHSPVSSPLTFFYFAYILWNQGSWFDNFVIVMIKKKCQCDLLVYLVICINRIAHKGWFNFTNDGLIWTQWDLY